MNNRDLARCVSFCFFFSLFYAPFPYYFCKCTTIQWFTFAMHTQIHSHTHTNRHSLRADCVRLDYIFFFFFTNCKSMKQATTNNRTKCNVTREKQKRWYFLWIILLFVLYNWLLSPLFLFVSFLFLSLSQYVYVISFLYFLHFFSVHYFSDFSLVRKYTKRTGPIPQKSGSLLLYMCRLWTDDDFSNHRFL